MSAGRLAPLGCGVLLVLVGLFESSTGWQAAVALRFGVLIAMVATLGLLVLRRAGTNIAPPRALWPWISAAITSAVISLTRSPDISRAGPRGVVYIGLLMLGAAVYGLARSRECTLVPWLAMMTIIGGSFVLAAFVDMAPHPAADQVYHAGVFMYARRMAGVAFVAATACQALVLLKPTSRRYTLAGTTFLLFVIAASGSRGAFLAFLLFGLLLGVMCPRPTSWRFLRDSAAAAGIASAAVVALNATGAWHSHNIFVRAADAVANRAGEGQDLTTGRLAIWRMTIRQIERTPLFGSGPDAFAITWPDFSVPHPHNALLELLLEFGLVGGLLLLGIVINAVRLYGGARPLLAASRHTYEARILTAMLVSQVALGLVDGQLYWLFPFTLFAISAGLWCAAVEPGHASSATDAATTHRVAQ